MPWGDLQVTDQALRCCWHSRVILLWAAARAAKSPCGPQTFSYGLGEQVLGSNQTGMRPIASDHTIIGGRVRRIVVTLLAGGLTAAGLVTAVPAAQADTAPAAGTPATVSADALPTWQVNGVVWSQVLVGNTVYATGSFSKARPPGVAAGGAGEINAQNIFAYDILTGNRLPSIIRSTPRAWPSPPRRTVPASTSAATSPLSTVRPGATWPPSTPRRRPGCRLRPLRQQPGEGPGGLGVHPLHRW